MNLGHRVGVAGRLVDVELRQVVEVERRQVDPEVGGKLQPVRIPREIDLADAVVGDCHANRLRPVRVEVGALHDDEASAVARDDDRLAITRVDCRLQCLVSGDDLQVVTDEQTAPRAISTKRAFE